MRITITGKIIKIESKDYYVLTDKTGVMRCNIRGKFKKIYQHKKEKLKVLDVASVGDTVSISINNDGTGVIDKVHERTNYLSRKAPKIKGGLERGERYEQIVISNIDQVFIISSVFQPQFNNRFVDRMIVAAESNKIPVQLVMNKTDLIESNEFDDWLKIYEDAGYPVLLTSAANNKNIKELKERVRGNTCVFWGYSGVGKSSLVNAMFPDFNLKTGDISSYSNKGTHTTVTSRLIEVAKDTFIADTPGIREIEPYGIRREDLGHYFSEFAAYLPDCRFNTCTHHHEPGCAVIDAVESDEISVERYDSYLHLLENIEEDMCFQVSRKNR